MVRELDELAQKKALLVARCDATRVDFILEAQHLHRRVRWIDTSYQVAVAVAPKLKILAPFLGVFMARKLGRGPQILGMAQSLWQMGRQAWPFLQSFKSI